MARPNQLRTTASLVVGAALCALGLGATAPPNAQDAADPRIGSWNEIKVSGDYQSLLRVFEKLDNGMVRMHVNAKLDINNRWHVDFRCDGQKYRTLTYDGKFTGVTYACRQTAERTIESSFTYEQADPRVDLGGTKPDQVSGVWKDEISADGKTYVSTGVTTLKSGQTREGRREFVRRG